MAAPALKIVLRPGKRPAGDDMPDEAPEKGPRGYDEPDEGEDLTAGAKREALGKLAAALGLEVQDEDAALEALESLIYHCSEG